MATRTQRSDRTSSEPKRTSSVAIVATQVGPVGSLVALPVQCCRSTVCLHLAPPTDQSQVRNWPHRTTGSIATPTRTNQLGTPPHRRGYALASLRYPFGTTACKATCSSATQRRTRGLSTARARAKAPRLRGLVRRVRSTRRRQPATRDRQGARILPIRRRSAQPGVLRKGVATAGTRWAHATRNVRGADSHLAGLARG